MSAKIIVTGSVHGQLHEFFGKIQKLNAKTPFAFLLISGDLFGSPGEDTDEVDESVRSLLEGKIEVPLPTYFGLGQNALPSTVIERIEANDGEICPNLYFLGKRSTTKTSDAVRIVALGGSLDPNVTAGLSQDKHLPFHTESDARALHGANSAHILVTTSWPLNVRDGANAVFPENVEEPSSEACIADLCASLRPRYHFSPATDFFYEREPFYHPLNSDAPHERHVTRFISLASFNSPSKAKWLYAFSLDPAAPALTESSLPPMTTPSPFRPSRKRPLESQADGFSRFSRGDAHGPRGAKRRNKQKKTPLTSSECFFCLSNPSVSTHMITAIGDEVYMTTARGPLVTTDEIEPLPFPGHMLIIPLAHVSTLSMVKETETRTKTFTEMQSYRRAMINMLKEHGKGALGAVTWEISWQRGVHVHWQFLPVKKEFIEKGLVEAAFKVQAENNKYPEIERQDIGDGVGEGEYFRVWIWSPDSEPLASDGESHASDSVGGSEVSLVMKLSMEERFDVQFGRRVMAKLLEIGHRTDWKDCVQSVDDETKDADAFKKAFEKWDFSSGE